MAIAFDDLFGGSVYVNFLGSNNLSVYTTSAGGPSSNGTFLPTANALVLALVATSDTTSAGTFYWNDTTPYNFTQVGSSPFAFTGGDAVPRKLYVFRALRSSWGATAKTASFDVTGDAATGAHVSLVQFTGVDTSGTNGSGAVVQETSAINQSSANPALTLSALTGSSNAVIASFANGLNPFAGTAEASWTERRDTGYATPTSGHYIVYRLATTDNTIVVTRAATNWSGWAAELKVQGAATLEAAAGLDATVEIGTAGLSVFERASTIDAFADVATAGEFEAPYPYQVENLIANAISTSEIELSWDDVAALSGEVFDIERDGVVIEEDYAGTHTAGSPYVDSGLAPDTEYEYRVRAVGGTP